MHLYLWKLLILLYLKVKMTSTSCIGLGFPAAWTTETAGVTFWFVTEDIKRQYTQWYGWTDYHIPGGNVPYGPSPACDDEYYDASTGYYYYLMTFSGNNVYDTNSGVQICHGFKQFDSVLREYYEVLGKSPSPTTKTAFECVALLASKTISIALTKYDYQWVDCPSAFSLVNYYVTFSYGGNVDYCASSQASTAGIEFETIALKSCFNHANVNSANPFYGPMFCLGHWSAESRDITTNGDFIVVEMVDATQWPYCGRYKVAADGTITLSLYLSMSIDPFFPAFCDGAKDNEYYQDSGEYVRMVFTPVNPLTSVITTAASNVRSTESTAQLTTEQLSKTSEPASTSSSTTALTSEPTTTSSATQPTTEQSSTTSTTQLTSEPSSITDSTTTELSLTTSTTQTTSGTTSETTQTTTTTLATTGTTTLGVTVATVNTTAGNTTSSSRNFWDRLQDLYWPWWVLVAASAIILVSACTLLIAFLRRRKKMKVENSKRIPPKGDNLANDTINGQPKQTKTTRISSPRSPPGVKGTKSNIIRVGEFKKPIPW